MSAVILIQAFLFEQKMLGWQHQFFYFLLILQFYFEQIISFFNKAEKTLFSILLKLLNIKTIRNFFSWQFQNI